MNDAITRIKKRLHWASRRERGLLVAQSLIQLSVVGIGFLTLAAWALDWGWSRVQVLDGLGAIALLAVLISGTLPLVLKWRDAGNIRAQARRIEAAHPPIGHRLITALDRAEAAMEEGAKPAPTGVSVVLLERAIQHASNELEHVPHDRIHPVRQLTKPAGFLFGTLLSCFLASSFLRTSPLDVIPILLEAPSRLSPRTPVAPVPVVEQALVGDIVLRYHYPEYTGLSVLEVANSDGTIYGPVGTKVHFRARTAKVFEEAQLELSGQSPIPITLEGGRDISGELVIEQSGSWRLILLRGESISVSDYYPINVETDAPPVVTLEMPEGASMPFDEPLGIEWTAEDDYGLQKVVLEVEYSDGSTREFPLRTPEDPTERLDDRLRFFPSELGLKPGDQAKMRVVAYDNTQNGDGARGESATVEWGVGRSREWGPALQAYHQELRDALIPILADFLEEPVPPHTGVREMNAWALTLSDRFAPVQAIYEKQWGSQGSDSLDAELIGTALDNARRLSRFVIVTWDEGSKSQSKEEDIRAVRSLHDEVVVSLEMAIFIIDRVLKQVALSKVVEQSQQLASEAQDLAALPDDADADEILASLDQLQRLLSSLQEAAQELSDSGLEGFVNSRAQETMNLMDQVRKAVSEGRMDDARELMDKLAEQVQQVAESMADQFAQQQQGEDELRKAFEQLQADLEQLALDQESLANELEAARKEFGEDLQERMDLWRELDRLADSAVASTQKALDATGHGQGWSPTVIRKLEDPRYGLSPAAASVQESIQARDVDNATDETRSAMYAADDAKDYIVRAKSQAMRRNQEPPSGWSDAKAGVEQVNQDLMAIEEILEQIRNSSATEPPELRELAQQMSEQQQELQQRQEQLSGDMQRIEQALPTADGSASESMRKGNRSMERAEDSLQRGESMQGEDHQRDAAQHIRDAKERMEQQMQQAAAMQRLGQQMQSGSSGGQNPPGGESQGDGDGNHLDPSDFILPVPEAFQTPEEYRRALLEGMQADVPEEYRSLNQRYFEELVRQ